MFKIFLFCVNNKKKGNKFYRSLNNFEALPNSLNTFLCFMVGRDAVFVESLPEECLVDCVHELFAKCFPRLKLPRPSRVLL